MRKRRGDDRPDDTTEDGHAGHFPGVLAAFVDTHLRDLSGAALPGVTIYSLMSEHLIHWVELVLTFQYDCLDQSPLDPSVSLAHEVNGRIVAVTGIEWNVEESNANDFFDWALLQTEVLLHIAQLKRFVPGSPPAG